MFWKPIFSTHFPLFSPLKREEGEEVGLAEFKRLNFRDRVHIVARSCKHGSHTPSLLSVLFYLAKAMLYFYILIRLCVRENETDERTFIRILVFTNLWECLGLGTGSGPSAGKFLPPVLTSFFHFVYMGTAKIPTRLFPKQTRRGLVDVALFSLYLNYSVKLALGANTAEGDGDLLLQNMYVWLLTIIALSVSDQVFFLASRSQITGSMMVVATLAGVFGGDPVVLLKFGVGWIQFFTWFWEGVSKLGIWWDYVPPVLASNSPMLQFFPAARQVFYDNLAPSTFARLVARASALLQIAFPLCLVVGGPYLGPFGVLAAIILHAFSSTGAPLEWNLFTSLHAMYCFTDVDHVFQRLKSGALPDKIGFPGLFQFPANNALAFAAITGYILAVHVLLPLYGNLFPDKVPVLLIAHRHGAGNGPTSCWLVRRNAMHKLSKLWTFSDLPHLQLARLYLGESLEQVEYQTLVGGMLHLNSRALLKLLPLAVAGEKEEAAAATALLDEYEIIDGEQLAGTVLGWGLGDGQFAGRELLAEIQSRCEFEADEIKCIAIGSFPLQRNAAGELELNWEILNAQAQQEHSGRFSATELINL